MAAHEYYGIDAPTVVRNLALGGAALIVAGLVATRFASLARFGSPLCTTGIIMAFMACWMLVSSLWLKHRVMRAMLARRHWRGDETVLDVGCGRGLVAVEAARHVPRGAVHGLDLWQDVDLSGNTPEGLLANARAAGVESRLTADTGDARAMPYPNGMFDVIASMTALHNIPDVSGRRAAIAEIWRVTKPGGQILIFDIRHARSYLRQLRDLGASDIKLTGPILLWGPIGWRFSARKPG